MGILIFICHNGHQKASVAYNLKNISEEERHHLEYFLRSEFSYLGYSLFGNKPMAVLGFYDPIAKINNCHEMLAHIYCVFDQSNLSNYRGWELWKKHQKLFPMERYAFIESKNFIENNYKAIIFINKKAFLKTVGEHLNDFKEVLGSHATPEWLLDAVLKSNNVFGDVFKHHQGLIGTVLGYGRQNAWLFHQREELSSLSGRVSPLLKRPSRFVEKLSKPLSQEKWDDLNQKLEGFDDRGILGFNPLLMRLPSFAADLNSKETKQLKIEYEQQYREILHRYQKGSFLKITIEQMTARKDMKK